MIRQTLIEKIKNNNYSKKSKSIISLCKDINENDEWFSYRELIRWDLHTPNIPFGKYFKENGGIQPNIGRVYFYKRDYINNVKSFRKCLICDIQIYEKIYACYIEANYEHGCSSCGMGRNEDNRMYISDTIETLILYSLPPYSACFIEPDST